MKKREKQRQAAAMAICAAAGILLYAALTFLDSENGYLGGDGAIARGDYGTSAREYEVFVEGLAEEELPLSVLVNAKVYTQREAQDLFTDILDHIEELILGENESLWQVQKNLSLITRVPGTGVKISWSSSDPDIMDEEGKLQGETDQERELVLTAVLSAATGEAGQPVKTLRQTFELPVRVLPPEKTKEERLRSAFLSAVREAEDNQRLQESFLLPAEFEGRVLRYRSGEKEDYRAILLLGFIAALLVPFLKQSREKDAKKKREKELGLDYSDMLSKFVVLTGAGLTMRNVWERIARDAEEEAEKKHKKPRALYEEMAKTAAQMRNGISEQEAYRDFGRRCGLSHYLKFAGLLEQNCRSGTKNLRELLQSEMTEALQERKNLARRLGEEAGTKLLLPLFLMLGIVMAMIMVPALMSMG